MRKVFYSVKLIFICLLFHINIGPAQLESFGLPGEKINAVALFPHDIHPWQYYLCAGSDSNGVFIRNLSSPDSLWVNRGLVGKKITSLHVYHWGVGPVAFNSIFAGVRPNKSAGDSTLIFECSNLRDWYAADSGISAKLVDQINTIGGFFFTGHAPPEPIFVGDFNGIYRAIGFPPNLIWQKVWPVGGFFIVNVIQIYRSGIFDSEGIIWVGGETGFFAPFLLKSMDKGNTWDDFYPYLEGDNACNSISVYQQNPNIVYAGMEGMVIKTSDGGQNWIITALQNTPYYFFGIVVNPRNSNHVITGGSTYLNKFGLFETTDGGSNWIEIQPTVPIAGLSGMVADTTNGELVVYMGTYGDGLYQYKTPLVGIDEEIFRKIAYSIELHQNYPNPFNPLTTIEFDLPKTSNVTLKIFNILGEEVATLVSDRLSAGSYSYQWSRSAEMASGVYLYRLQAEEYVETRKMMLMK